MVAVASSFLGMIVKAVFLFMLAWAGIVCGKKFRIHRNEKKALESREG